MEDQDQSLVVLHTPQHIVTWNTGAENFVVVPGNGVPVPHRRLYQCPLCGQRLNNRIYIARRYFQFLATGSISNDQDEAEHFDRFLNNGYYSTFFREVSRLGGGGFASVFRVEHLLKGQTLGTYTVKKIPVGDTEEFLLRAIREAAVLCRLRHHPNIITYHHSWLENDCTVSDFGPSVMCLFLLMDYADESLQDYIFKDKEGRIGFGFKEGLTDEEVWIHFMSLCSGMKFLHAHDILHRDLKPQNLLISQEQGLQITDFGLCSAMGQGDGTRPSGTVHYMAPELLEVVDGQYVGEATTASDVWSMGVCLYVMMYSALPWDTCYLPRGFTHDSDEVLDTANIIRSFTEIVLPAIPERPRTLKSLILAMLDRNPLNRPAVEDILKECTKISSMEGAVEQPPNPSKNHIPLLYTLCIALEMWIVVSMCGSIGPFTMMLVLALGIVLMMKLDSIWSYLSCCVLWGVPIVLSCDYSGIGVACNSVVCGSIAWFIYHRLNKSSISLQLEH